jgi:hypothetical protein
MPKITLSFNMDEPEDRASFEVTHKAQDLLSVIWELDQALRSGEKYGGIGDKQLSLSEQDLVSFIRDKLHQLCSERSISLMELMQ